ncbi:MAG: TonB-dependent receptor plug domain-containing protein, partial [Rhodobacteraceae bacterium]|nr:TonB-dependent receptor plug domain-containing protein [Paracoccaceae bacterium]
MSAKRCHALSFIAICLTLPFTVASNPVLARQAALEEVIVTAQKREQGINDVGISVNAFTATQLENYGVRSAEDLETITPGLTITEAQPNGVPVYTIRGVGFADFTTSASSTVGLYFDETNLPYSVMSRGVLFDMERVEVLKGPQGDLYGRNSTAGQINFVSRKPTEEFAGGLKLGYSRFDVIDAEAYVSGPLTDKVRARLAVKTTQSAGDGWQKSLSRPGDRLGEYDDIAVRGLLDLDLNDNAALFINLHWYEDHSDNMAATPVDGMQIGQETSLFLPTPGNIIFSEGRNRAADWSPDHPPQRDNTLKGASVKLDWDMSGVNLTTISSYDKFDRAETFDTSGVAFEDADILNNT